MSTIQERFDTDRGRGLLEAAAATIVMLGAGALGLAAATAYALFVVVSAEVLTNAGMDPAAMDALGFILSLPVVAAVAYAGARVVSIVGGVEVSATNTAAAVAGVVVLVQGVLLNIGVGWLGSL